MPVNLKRGFARLFVVISGLSVAAALAVGTYDWRLAKQYWREATTQPRGEVVVLLTSGFGYIRFPEGTPPGVARERIDRLRTLPDEAHLLDCSAEWVDIGTTTEVEGCNMVPVSALDFEVGYIRDWPTEKHTRPILYSRNDIAESEQRNSLPAAVKRSLAHARLRNQWPREMRRPSLALFVPSFQVTAIAVLCLWLTYAILLWVARGFRTADGR